MRSLPSRRRLRSSGVHAALLGAATFLGGCDKPVDLTFFDSAESCRTEAATSSEFTAAQCDEAFAQAESEHAKLAPRYDSQELCEEVHGQGTCGTSEQAGVAPAGDQAASEEPAQAGHATSFSPFLAGYMIGHLANRGFGAQTPANMGRPLYREAAGGFGTSDGRAYGFGRSGQTVVGGASALKAPTATARSTAVMTRATVSTRGGFGAGRTGSYGG